MASNSSAGTDLNKRIEAARAKIQAKLAGGASESESVTPSVGAKKKIILSRSKSQKAAEHSMKKPNVTASPAGTAKSVESEADKALRLRNEELERAVAEAKAKEEERLAKKERKRKAREEEEKRRKEEEEKQRLEEEERRRKEEEEARKKIEEEERRLKEEAERKAREEEERLRREEEQEIKEEEEKRKREEEERRKDEEGARRRKAQKRGGGAARKRKEAEEGRRKRRATKKGEARQSFLGGAEFFANALQIGSSHQRTRRGRKAD